MSYAKLNQEEEFSPFTEETPKGPVVPSLSQANSTTTTENKTDLSYYSPPTTEEQNSGNVESTTNTDNISTDQRGLNQMWYNCIVLPNLDSKNWFTENPADFSHVHRARGVFFFRFLVGLFVFIIGMVIGVMFGVYGSLLGLWIVTIILMPCFAICLLGCCIYKPAGASIGCALFTMISLVWFATLFFQAYQEIVSGPIYWSVSPLIWINMSKTATVNLDQDVIVYTNITGQYQSSNNNYYCISPAVYSNQTTLFEQYLWGACQSSSPCNSSNFLNSDCYDSWTNNWTTGWLYDNSIWMNATKNLYISPKSIWSAQNITVNQNSYFIEFVPSDIASGYAAEGFFFCLFSSIFIYYIS